MSVRYARVTPHHAGFNMYQAGPEWTTFGTEYGEFKEGDAEVDNATLDDWVEWLTNFGSVDTSEEATSEYDGNTYDQSGMIYVLTDFDDEQAVYCAYEETVEPL